MNKLYIFSMLFSGSQEVWLEAESEEEAWAMVRNGDWEDSEEQTHESDPASSILLRTEEIE